MKVKCIDSVWSRWNNIYRCVVYSGKEYDVLKESEDGYIIRNEFGILDDYPKGAFEEVKEMEKEKVLEVEFQDVFDKVAWRIIYQNTDVIIKSEWKDGRLGFTSVKSPTAYFSKLVLYNSGEIDNRGIGIMSKEASEKFKEIVCEVNKEYGIIKRWRAKIGEVYYYIDSDGTITVKEECGTTMDDGRYKFGNYAKTKEELEFEKLEKIKNILFE